MSNVAGSWIVGLTHYRFLQSFEFLIVADAAGEDARRDSRRDAGATFFAECY